MSDKIEWDEARRQRLEIDGHRCRMCNAPNEVIALQAHHRTYERKGCENVQDDLTMVCTDCHNLFHRNRSLYPSTPKDVQKLRRENDSLREKLEAFKKKHGPIAVSHLEL